MLKRNDGFLKVIRILSISVFAFIYPLGILEVNAGNNYWHDSLKNNLRKPPNIILILADDLGYGDLNIYGNTKVNTPNISRLADEGTLFTDFHTNGPMCSPTRAALLTGRYQQRTGVETVGGVLHNNEIVIAKRLQEAGFACGMFGKWHISGHNKSPDYYRDRRLPTDYGFDEFRGIMSGFIDPVSHITDIGLNDWWHNDQLIEEEGYSTNLLTKHAIQFIQEHKEQPFFVYLSLTDIHFPWMLPDDQPYFKKGETYKNFDFNHNRLGPHDGSDSLQRIVYRMIEETDRSVGNIIKVIKDLNLSENTLIFFTSDNGGYKDYQGSNSGHISDMGPYRGQKESLYEGGHRVPAIARWLGHIPAGKISDEITMTFDLFPTFLELANLNSPDSNNLNKLDGTSLVPLLLYNKKLPERKLYWAFLNSRAIRERDWKLIVKKTGTPELYNLTNDPGETNNLAKKFPARTDSLILSISSWELDVFHKKIIYK